MKLNHPPVFGVSKDWMEKRKDDMAAAKLEAETIPMNIIRATPAYQMLLRQNEALERQLDVLKSKLDEIGELPKRKTVRRRSSNNARHGREKAQPVILHKGVTYYSMSHVSYLASLHISSVSRQIDTLGIKCTNIGGIKYIPAAQASNIKKKRARR